MGLFYTKKGDKGYSYIGKKKIYKLNPFVAALGELDQLNSLIGIVKSQKIPTSLKKILHQVQENLFIIQANLAYAMLKEKRKPPAFSSKKTKETESIIDNIERKLKPAKRFVISGSTNISAWLDYLRAFSRKVERDVLGLKKLGNLDENILPYLNRLSSLFFALARWEAKQAGKKEQNPTYK